MAKKKEFERLIAIIPSKLAKYNCEITNVERRNDLLNIQKAGSKANLNEKI